MNNIINEILKIEEQACIKIDDAKIVADEMVRNAHAQSENRIESIKHKALRQIEEIDMQSKAQADAKIEAQQVLYEQKSNALKACFEKNTEKISNEIFNAIIGEF